MRIRKLVCILGFALCSTVFAADLPPPILNVTVSNNVKTITWGPLVPALEALRLVSGVDLLTMSNNTAAVLFKSAAQVVVDRSAMRKDVAMRFMERFLFVAWFIHC